MMKIALATCCKLPEPDFDETLLVEALEKRGATVRMMAWDDPAHAASADEVVVLRSTWNYVHHLDAFLAWVEKTASTARLFNPAPIVRANARKTYLQELASRGIAIIPTEFVTRGAPHRLDDAPW